MAGTVKHLSLHRIAGTELRVVADVETGVFPVIEAEETVIRRYARHRSWAHRWVTLFVLRDLGSLVRQLEAATGHPTGDAAALGGRPVVTVYDLADLTSCQVFVNREEMRRAGYWNDALATRGLLAHEHAHPLAENDTIRESRRWRLQLRLAEEATTLAPLAPCPATVWARTDDVVSALAEKLVLTAPREVFTNEVAIRHGFGDALLHLNQHNIDTAARSVAQRTEVSRRLEGEVARGALDLGEANLLLLIGDLNAYLDMAMEVASFDRAGWPGAAQLLAATLARTIFPHLAPEVPAAFIALRQQYAALGADLTPSRFVEWGNGALTCLQQVLAEQGMALQSEWQVRHG